MSRDPVEWSYVERLLPTKKIIKTDFAGMVINTFFSLDILHLATISLSPGETRVKESSRDMDGHYT